MDTQAVKELMCMYSPYPHIHGHPDTALYFSFSWIVILEGIDTQTVELMHTYSPVPIFIDTQTLCTLLWFTVILAGMDTQTVEE